MSTTVARPVGWTGPTGAKVVKHLRGVAPLDRHTPTREYGVPTIEVIEWPPREDGFVGIELTIVGGLDIFKHARDALWLIDDGEKVVTYYTCGYHETHRYVGLKTFPAGLEIGPRMTYYVRVTEAA